MKNKSELTPAQRTMLAQMAAHTLHATHDSTKLTENARKASNVTRFEKMVDPNNELPEDERRRRVDQARSAYMRGLAYKRSRTASKKKADRAKSSQEKPIG